MISLVRGRLYEKITQVYWDLIKAVAHLHKICMTHRDIKPEDLVVEWDFLPENDRLGLPLCE